MNREFNKLWASSTFANLGDGLARAAFPLLAALLTRDPVLVAGLTVAFTLPWLIFSLPAGALVDRSDRRQILIKVSTLRVGLLIGLGILLNLELVTIPALYIIAFIFGITEVVFDNTSMTILPSIVEDKDLEKANSRLFSSALIGNHFIGPSLGGWLFSLAAASPFYLHSGFLAFAAALVYLLRGSFRETRAVEQRKKGMWIEIKEGLKWLRGNRILFSMAVMAGITNIAGTASFSILVLYALDILGLNEAAYGLLIASGTLGGLLGTVSGVRISAKLGSGTTLLMAIIMEGLSYIFIVIYPNVYAAGAAIAFHAFAIVLWNINAVSLRQSITPNHLLGRINSTYRFIGEGATPLGALAGGFLASSFGLSTPFWFAGIGVLISVFFVMSIINNKNIEIARQAVELD